jgi:hypothetical protein
VAELDAAVSLPGVTNIWTQPIRNRIDMLATGIRTRGRAEDLWCRSEGARRAGAGGGAGVLRAIPGAGDVYAEQIAGAPYLNIRIDRQAAASLRCRSRRGPGGDRKGGWRDQSERRRSRDDSAFRCGFATRQSFASDPATNRSGCWSARSRFRWLRSPTITAASAGRL